MVLDYKGVSFSFNDIRKSKRLKRFRLIGVVVLVLLVLLWLWNALDWGRVVRGRDLLLAGKLTEARQYVENLLPALFHGQAKKELRALLHLHEGETSAAQTLLATLTDSESGLKPDKFLAYYTDRATYHSLKVYTDFLLQKKSQPSQRENWQYYKALYSSGLFLHQQSEEAIAALSASQKQAHQKELELVHRVNQQVRNGRLHYIFDVNDKPLAYYDLGAQKTVSLTPGMEFADFTPLIKTGVQFFGLTLDREVQQRLQVLFRDLNGTFLMFNVADSSIVAAYSKSLATNGHTPGNTVFSRYYEPGSIVKPLTLLAYLASPQVTKGGLFPLQCSGNWPVNERLFSDWTVHHQVNNPEEAMAVSCNIAFARMGTGVGAPHLKGMLQRFFFNSAPFQDQFLAFHTGKTRQNTLNPYQLANMAVGLNEISITTFHAALIFTILADNGSIYQPYLLKNRKNLLNIGYYTHGSRLIQIFKDNSAFLKVKNAMVYVVESSAGTGRRAKVEGLMMAVKTGTAGNKQDGLDAMLTGFFPAEKPAYAFAFQLEHAGKAEWRGALFLKDFLTSVGLYGPSSGNR